jgi:hypothetical protein
MSMHLVGPYLTTTRYNRKKGKVTQAQMNRWVEGYKERCKLNKRLSLPSMTFEEYVDALHGKVKKTEPTKRPALKFEEPSYRRESPRIPSLSELEGSKNWAPESTAKKEPQQYTGTLIKGIATMHKSNAVPIIDQKQAIEISQMRRS